MTNLNLKSVANTCVLLALVASVLSARAELQPEDIYAAISPSVVSLEVENVAGKHFVGSGFLALEKGLAVTAWHVVHDARQVEAVFADGQRVAVAGVVDKDEAKDLAIIKLPTGNRPLLKLDQATPRIGSRVYVFGSPRGFDFSIGDGLVSQIRAVEGIRYYQLSCPVSPGDSGGPVVNSRGKVIGVMAWRKADAENLGFAVPSPVVADLDCGLPTVAWSVTSSAVPAGPNSPEFRPVVRSTLNAEQSNPYEEFLTSLSRRAGDRVSVSLQDANGKVTLFRFNVPKP